MSMYIVIIEYMLYSDYTCICVRVKMCVCVCTCVYIHVHTRKLTSFLIVSFCSNNFSVSNNDTSYTIPHSTRPLVNSRFTGFCINNNTCMIVDNNNYYRASLGIQDSW